jgi:hypothetical protein
MMVRAATTTWSSVRPCDNGRRTCPPPGIRQPRVGLLQPRTVVTVSEILDRIDRELPVAVAAELRRLRAENARLLRLLDLTAREAAPPGPAQAGFFEAPPGPVHANSAAEEKAAFFGALFAARTDVYAIRYDNRRTGKAGWVPAMRGGFRKGVPRSEWDYLPLTAEVLAGHLSGKMHTGLYPLIDGDLCWWLAADFDGPDALIDALMYLKAARALGVPAALEVSRSGVPSEGSAGAPTAVPASIRAPRGARSRTGMSCPYPRLRRRARRGSSSRWHWRYARCASRGASVGGRDRCGRQGAGARRGGV